MKMFNKNALALATVAMLATGLSSQAHAGAIAYSHLNIFDFTIKNGGGTTIKLTDINLGGGLSGGNTSTNFGNLNSINGANGQSTNAGPAFIGIDAALACEGDCGMAENDFTQQAVGTHFSRGDSSLQGAIITGLIALDPSANANTVAEVQLTGTDAGNSSGQVGTTTGFTFSLNNASLIQFDFDATLDLFAELHSVALSGSATASSNFSITITGDENLDGNDETLFSWTPDGLLQANGTNGVFAETDGCDLTQSAVTSSPGAFSNETCNGGAYLASTKVLSQDVRYTLSIEHGSIARANVIKKVPEPASLVLFGMSLLGFGVARRINSKT